MPKLTTISSTPDCSSSSPTCWEARNVLRRFGPSVLLRACCCSVCFVASGPEICGLRSSSCGRAFRPTTSTFFRGIGSSVCRHDLPAQFGSSRGSSPEWIGVLPREAEKPRAKNAGLAEAVYEHRPRKAKWMIKVWWENVHGFSKALAQGTHRQAGAVGILVVETTKWRWTRHTSVSSRVSGVEPEQNHFHLSLLPFSKWHQG